MAGVSSSGARRGLAVVVDPVAGLAVPAVTALPRNFGGSNDRFFTVEWQIVRDKGRPAAAAGAR